MASDTIPDLRAAAMDALVYLSDRYGHTVEDDGEDNWARFMAIQRALANTELSPTIGPIQHINSLCQKTGCDCWCQACERHNWRHERANTEPVSPDLRAAWTSCEACWQHVRTHHPDLTEPVSPDLTERADEDVCPYCVPEHVWPCPTIPRCDEPGCKGMATCGWPSDAGYRRTCGGHYVKEPHR